MLVLFGAEDKSEPLSRSIVKLISGSTLVHCKYTERLTLVLVEFIFVLLLVAVKKTGGCCWAGVTFLINIDFCSLWCVFL